MTYSTIRSTLHHRFATAARPVASICNHLTWESRLSLQMGMTAMTEGLGCGLLMTIAINFSFTLIASLGSKQQWILPAVAEITINQLGFASIDSESLALIAGEISDHREHRTISLFLGGHTVTSHSHRSAESIQPSHARSVRVNTGFGWSLVEPLRYAVQREHYHCRYSRFLLSAIQCQCQTDHFLSGERQGPYHDTVAAELSRVEPAPLGHDVDRLTQLCDYRKIDLADIDRVSSERHCSVH